MPGFLLNVSTVETMKCPHGGTCEVIPSQFAVLIDGSPMITMADQIFVLGCLFELPGPVPSPCVKVVWTEPALAAQADLSAGLVQPSPGTGMAICFSAEELPQGPPIISQLQVAVRGA